MRSFSIDFSFMHEYNKNVLPRGDKLLSIAGLVEWKRFSHIADGATTKTIPNAEVDLILTLL